MNKLGEITLANLPTKIEKLKSFSQKFYGTDIYIKRDDYTGMEVSGNKVRKLEFTLKDALEKGCDSVITCGGIQSNHARATVVCATKLGLKSYLVLKGNDKEYNRGNHFIDRVLGAQVKFISDEEYKHNRNEIMEAFKKELEAKGHKPYIMPEGASNGIGNFGYMKAFDEILEQEKELGISFHVICVAVGSGGTYGGLFLGNEIHKSGKKIFGINIYDDKVDYVDKVYNLMDESHKYMEENISCSKDDINIIDDYVGEGYGKTTDEQIKFIIEVARKEGIMLDTVYTGKAFYGLIQELKKGTIGEKVNVLFIHTGGQFGNFAKSELFEPFI
ncbi:D-cysteine desulfhydrase family protein [Wukongibacter sp. M2B1]|uniref:D-cysteine desulfhydrase family protein n=1 Tax=Wukongibacter sp. M2B1 TaxID=3088895 RepID=UPI003D7B4A54